MFCLFPDEFLLSACCVPGTVHTRGRGTFLHRLREPRERACEARACWWPPAPAAGLCRVSFRWSRSNLRHHREGAAPSQPIPTKERSGRERWGTRAGSDNSVQPRGAQASGGGQVWQKPPALPFHSDLAFQREGQERAAPHPPSLRGGISPTAASSLIPPSIRDSPSTPSCFLQIKTPPTSGLQRDGSRQAPARHAHSPAAGAPCSRGVFFFLSERAQALSLAWGDAPPGRAGCRCQGWRQALAAPRLPWAVWRD